MGFSVSLTWDFYFIFLILANLVVVIMTKIKYKIFDFTINGYSFATVIIVAILILGIDLYMTEAKEEKPEYLIFTVATIIITISTGVFIAFIQNITGYINGKKSDKYNEKIENDIKMIQGQLIHIAYLQNQGKLDHNQNPNETNLKLH